MRYFPTISVVLLLTVVAATGPLAAADGSANLIANGDFEVKDTEGGPANWGVHDWGDKSLASGRIVGGGQVGSQCLEISGEASPVYYGYFAEPVTLGPTPPARLLLSFWYRTKGHPRPDVTFATFSENFAAAEWRTPVLNTEAASVAESDKWRRQVVEIRCLPSVQQAIVNIRIHDEGKLWLDGVSLRAVPAEVACEVEDAGLVTAVNGARACRVTVRNTTDADLPVSLQLEATAPKNPRGHAEANVTLKPGASQTVDLHYNFPVSATHRLELTVASQRPGPVYAYRQWQMPGLIEARLTRPAFRATVLPSNPEGEIEVRGHLNASRELAAGLDLQAALLGASTAEAKPELDADGTFQVAFQAPGMLTGNYGAQITALEKGREVARLVVPVARSGAQTAEASYDEQMRFRIKGARIFPFGLFYALEPADMADAAAAGVNCLVSPSRTMSTRTMAAAGDLGLSVLVSSASLESDFWEHTVNKYAGSGELAGWYVVQRPDSHVAETGPETMADLYGRLRRLDPTHPVCMALESPSRMDLYADECDIIMPWTDPRPVGDLRTVDTMIRRALEVARGVRPVWPIIQLTGGAYYVDKRLDPKDNGRPPTPDEYSCMVYLALARGANGVFNFALSNPGSAYQRAFDVRRDAPEVWAMVQAVGQQIKALSPALLDGEAQTLDLAPESPVAMRAIRHGDFLYVIAANPLREPVDVTFSLPQAGVSELQRGQDTAPLTAADGAFTETLEPHGVRLYTAAVASAKVE